jgi:hypothetical protein
MSRKDAVVTKASLATESATSERTVSLYRCRQDWEQLKETNHPEVRFCDGCSRSVFRARDHEGFLQLAAADKCVWIENEEPIFGMPVTQYQARKPLDWDDEK